MHPQATPRLSVKMQPGDLVFTNNHWVFHARSAYHDVDIYARRHKTRVWVQY